MKVLKSDRSQEEIIAKHIISSKEFGELYSAYRDKFVASHHLTSETRLPRRT